jgi:hypothetical protein
MKRARSQPCADAGTHIPRSPEAPLSGGGGRPDRRVHWRCYHCGDTFTKAQARWARQHFGRDEGELPVCQMRLPGEHHLLAALRSAQDELATYRAEDTDLMRAIYTMQAEHAGALRREEERGYGKGVADARAEASPLGAELGSNENDRAQLPRDPGSCELDDSGWLLAFVGALHAPGIAGPMSWSDFSDEQRERIKEAWRALVATALSSEAQPVSSAEGRGGNLPPSELSRLQHSLSLAVEALGPFAAMAPRYQYHRQQVLGWTTADGGRVYVEGSDFLRVREVHSKLTGGG